MARLTLNRRRLSVSAEVPEPIAARMRTIRRQLRSGRRHGAPRRGNLVIADKVPPLHLDRRAPADALPFFMGLMDRRAPESSAVGHDGDRDVDRDVDLAARVPTVFWYHTIELPGGIVTPGVYDHRPLVPEYGFPADLEGKRALDVATYDGFWAFELERRGADVVAADVPRLSACDLPPPVRSAIVAAGLDMETGVGFRMAHQALGSRVERIECSVYDLDPADLGTFDFVHVADLLTHLETPLAALRAIRRVTSGAALVVDCFDPGLLGRLTHYTGGWLGVTWWAPSLDTLAQMVVDAGFADVEVRLVYSLPHVGEERGPWRASLLATT